MPWIPLALSLVPFAPFLQKWLSGPQGSSVAQDVLTLVHEVTGQTLASREDAKDICDRFSREPNLRLELQKHLLEQETLWQRLSAEDRSSARTRDMAFIRSNRRNLRGDIMVISAALGLVSCLMSLCGFLGRLPGEAVGIISTIAGIFGACLKDAYAFEFGSSRGSKEKDATVSALLDKSL